MKNKSKLPKDEFLGKSPIIQFIELQIMANSFRELLLNMKKEKHKLSRNEMFVPKEEFTNLKEQIKKHYSEVYDGSMNFMNDLNKLKNQEEMKITEETKIKDLIPEGMEIDIDLQNSFKLDFANLSQIKIPLKKKEVKDFNWYLEKYFKVKYEPMPNGIFKLTQCSNETDYSHISTTFYEKASFESKIGLLKFICDDLELGLLDVLNDKLELYEKVKVESICPKEFLNSIFE